LIDIGLNKHHHHHTVAIMKSPFLSYMNTKYGVNAAFESCKQEYRDWYEKKRDREPVISPKSWIHQKAKVNAMFLVVLMQ